MRRYPLYIFDLDGTLYRGAQALPGAAETLADLRKEGSIVRFLTNNSSQTPESQSAKLSAMGIEARPQELLTSGMGAARYLSSKGITRAFVVGEPGLVQVLAAQSISMGDAADAVVVGICRSFTYDLLNQAMQHILTGAQFIATNTDSSYPMEAGLVPGAGSIVAAVQTCTGVQPVVIGKPETVLVEMILSETGVGPSDTLVVGDRFETDIVSGRDAGCDTLLVLTGVTKEPMPGQRNAKSLLALLDKSPLS